MSTFFPAEWSREKVMGKIVEAYKNFIKNGAKNFIKKGGKYVVTGAIEEGMEIQMYITRKGRVLTAYPILK